MLSRTVWKLAKPVWTMPNVTGSPEVESNCYEPIQKEARNWRANNEYIYKYKEGSGGESSILGCYQRLDIVQLPRSGARQAVEQLVSVELPEPYSENADTSKRKSYRVEKNSPSSIRGQFFSSTPPTCKKVDEIGMLSGSRVVHHCILVLFKNLFSDIILVTDSGKAGTDFWKCVDEGLKTAHEAKKDDTAKIAVFLAKILSND
ncbi:hypothetical protein GGU11DRAFT_758632 [Lentinula aff. detonsa]|nr:hypothetical protein GGU11DRAFT_758632 [Lentinula aff. detonsa]